jgi:pimeloyl-ACP methyl ester carboxylesterase
VPYLATASDANVYYEDFGDGTPIVFTHAAQATHAIWDHQTGVLADRFRTVTWDWRGVGRSDKPRTGYTLETLAGDLIALIEHLGVGPAVLVAQGSGTHAMLEAYYRRPDLVSKLVLVSGAPWHNGDRDGEKGGLSAEFTEWVNGEMAGGGQICAQFYANLYNRYMFHTDPGSAVGGWFLNMALETPMFVLDRYRRSLKVVDHREKLHTVTCPVMIAHGRYDSKQRYEGAEYLAKRLPDARLVTFEKSAHLPNLEEAARFNEELSRFAEEA